MFKMRVNCAHRSHRSASSSQQTLTSWLLQQERKGTADSDLVITLNSISSACKRISSLVARAPIDGMLGAQGNANASGDDQKKLDVIANDVFCAAVRDSMRTSIMVSEEEESPIALASSSGQYIVAFDPIDGSSNIDAAVTTGSIFGIYSAGECDFGEADSAEEVTAKCLTNVRKAGSELVAAGYCMFSSSCVFVLSIGHGVFGFYLDPTIGEFVLTHDTMRIPDPGQNIVSGNLGNTGLWDPALRDYAADLATRGFTYRYIGALVGDFHRTMLCAQAPGSSHLP